MQNIHVKFYLQFTIFREFAKYDRLGLNSKFCLKFVFSIWCSKTPKTKSNLVYFENFSLYRVLTTANNLVKNIKKLPSHEVWMAKKRLFPQ